MTIFFKVQHICQIYYWSKRHQCWFLVSLVPYCSSQLGLIQLEAGQIPPLSQIHLNQSLCKSLNISNPVPAKPGSYFGCIWQDKIISTQTPWFCLLPHHCILTLSILQQYVCVKKSPHKVSTLIQGTGVCSAMSHHSAVSNRGHSRTGQILSFVFWHPLKHPWRQFHINLLLVWCQLKIGPVSTAAMQGRHIHE